MGCLKLLIFLLLEKTILYQFNFGFFVVKCVFKLKLKKIFLNDIRQKRTCEKRYVHKVITSDRYHLIRNKRANVIRFFL